MTVLRPDTARFLKITGNSLKDGSTVQIKVVKPLAGGSWQVSIQGKLLAVRSDVPLRPGQVLKAGIRIQGSTVNLKLLPEKGTPLFTPQSGSGRMNTAVSLVLQRMSLPASESLINTLKKAASAAGKSFTERLTRMRLAAILTDKGLVPDEKLIDSLMSVIGDPGRRKHGHKHTKQNNHDQHGKDGEDEPSEKVFQDSLREQMTRAAEDPAGALQVFNHLQGKKQDWVLLPLSVEREGVVISGTLRLQLAPDLKTWLRGAIVVSCEEHIWRFILKKRTNQIAVEVIYPEGVRSGEIPESLSEFIKKCENIGIKIDDKVSKDEYFDGFSRESPDKNINTLV